MSTWQSAIRPLAARPGLSRILQNLFWLSADKGVAVLNGLLVGAYVARYLEPQRYGLFAYGFAIAAMLMPLIGLGFDKVMVRDYLRKPESRPQMLWSVFWLRLALGVALYLALSAMLHLGWMGESSPEGIRTLSILFLCLPVSAFGISRIALEAEVSSKYGVWIRNAVIILGAAIKVYLVHRQAGVEAFAITHVLSELAAAAITFGYCIHRGLLPALRGFQLNAIREMLRECWPLLVAAISIGLYMNIDIAMLRQMRSASMAGIYSVAVYLTSFWFFLPMAIAASFFPSLIARHSDGDRDYPEYLSQLFKLNALAAYLCLGISLVGFPFLIHHLYGPAYADAVSIVMIHIFCLPFVFMGVARNQHLIAKGQQILSMVYSISGLLTNVALNYALIQTHGAKGAALATVVSYAVAAFITSFQERPTRFIGWMQLRALLMPWPNLSRLSR